MLNAHDYAFLADFLRRRSGLSITLLICVILIFFILTYV